MEKKSTSPPKVIREITPTISPQETVRQKYHRIRVVAYCRVSTKQEEQLNSYETQLNYYTDRINREPDWEFVGIYADKGITGTSVKNRDEFKKMIRLCKRGKVDMIICKSISRFARNTVDCLKYTRMLKAIGVDVYFEEQGIHSTQPGAEFYITIYGSIAQSESENISANIKWGKAQRAKEGQVIFQYKKFLGYRKGKDGQPEIDETEAKTIRFIYERFLAGDGTQQIAEKLTAMQILTPTGKSIWNKDTVMSILTNEKYKGDAILNKTYVVDCLTKEVRKNNGERKKYYVENNHPAIIDAGTFARVQEELAKRSPKRQKETANGMKTMQVRYASKYALTSLLICGECKSPYNRYTWVRNGVKKIVWRCASRVRFGTKYCQHSSTIAEEVLHEAVMNAIMKMAQEDVGVLSTLKNHIGMVLGQGGVNDESDNIRIRIAEIDTEFQAMLNAITADMVGGFDEEKAQRLLTEKNELQEQLAKCAKEQEKRESINSRINEICSIVDMLKNRPLTFDDELVRKVVQCIVVESKEKIKVVMVGGTEKVETLRDVTVA
jgi:DNA invertase Pin-like site-specific DNA recombinase/uncharacterized OsmC-like protein